MLDDSLHPLEGLMDDLHEALRHGQLSLIESLLARIETEVGKAEGQDHHALRRLHAKAVRNGRLLEATGRGIRAARNRLAEIDAVRNGLTTYDRSGLRMDRLSQGNLSRRY